MTTGTDNPAHGSGKFRDRYIQEEPGQCRPAQRACKRYLQGPSRCYR